MGKGFPRAKRIVIGVVLVWFGAAMPGCQGRHFVNLGNGTAVPAKSLDTYAAEHDLSHESARAQLAQELEMRDAGDAANSNGVTSR